MWTLCLIRMQPYRIEVRFVRLLLDLESALVGNADAGKIFTTNGTKISQPFNPEKTENGTTKVQDGYFMIWDSKSKN